MDLVARLPALGFPVERVVDPAQTLGHLKVAEIQEASPHPDADRLRVCRVWTGTEIFQVVCGAPNARSGLKVILSRPGDLIPSTGAKLQKGTIRGVESQGMLCSYEELGLTSTDFPENPEGIIELATDTPVGLSACQALGLTDPMLEIEVTANRGDMLGIRGIARELAAAGLGRLKVSDKPQKIEEYPSFSWALMEGLTDGPSPLWLQKRLKSIGQASLGILVDVTNYILFDLGKPLHAFDADKLSGEIRLGTAFGGESFEGLDGKSYTLPPGADVVMDDLGIVGIAGILGGSRTAVTPSTTRVLLESAVFAPEAIAQTGQALGLYTEARARFERGVDPFLVTPGLARGIALLTEYAGGRLKTEGSLEKRTRTPQSFSFPYQKIQSLGGVTIPDDTVDAYLKDLGFQPVREGSGICQVTVPSWRFDVSGPPDVIEDCLRLHGYEHIPSVPLRFEPERSATTPLQKRPQEARVRLVAEGLQEVITWSFVSPEKAPLFGGGAPALVLENPISRDLSVMRPSLLPNLLDLVRQHQNRDLSFPGFFEVGPQYNGSQGQDQETVACGILSCAPTVSWRPALPPDALMVKRFLYGVIEALGLDPQRVPLTNGDAPHWYHPGRSGTVRLGPKTILAYGGEVHPKILEAFGIQDRAFVFEVFLDRFPARKPSFPKAPIPLSSFQSTPLDLAFLMDKETSAGTLLKVIEKTAGPDLQALQVFDVFEDPHKIGVGKKSVGVRLTLQSLKRTLTEGDIQTLITEITKAARTLVGAQLRDGGTL
jgi:phenylalanyl-tRNA synthetase beta chain